jgi:hypothetical protein
MGPIDALIHLGNLFMPALIVGTVSAAFAKLLWWRSLQGVRWSRLALWACGACALATVIGLVVFGRDGKMATYGAMVLASSLALMWAGFGSRRG